MKHNEVTMKGDNVPRPAFNFEESSLDTLIINKLTNSYDDPTVIQSVSWPIALSGRDMISVAQTGSGKTLAVLLFFLIINRIVLS